MPDLPTLHLPNMNESLAIAIIAVALSFSFWCAREWWKVEKPRREAKTKIETERMHSEAEADDRERKIDIDNKRKLGELYTSMSEDAPIKTALFQQQHELLRTIHADQKAHAETCKAGETAALENSKTLQIIATHLAKHRP